MKILDAIKKIKVLLGSVKLSQEQLADGNSQFAGSLIQYDGPSIAQGDVIYLVDPAGNYSILPDGQYQTKKGVTFVITDGSVSTSTDAADKAEAKQEPVAQAQAEQEVPVEMDAPATEATEAPAAETTIEVTPTVDINDLICQAMAPLVEKIAALETLIQAQVLMSNNTQVALSKVADQVAIIADSPAGTQIEKEVNSFAGVPKEVKDHKAAKYFAQ
jgi:hypothetical protein